MQLIEGNGLELPNGINPKDNICVVLKSEEGDKRWFYGSNLVTTDGDIYYAKKGAGDTITSEENFGRTNATCILQTGAVTGDDAPVKGDKYQDVLTPLVSNHNVGSSHANSETQLVESGYPKTAATSGADADNSSGGGTDAVTYKFTWGKLEINTGSGNPITGGCITDKDGSLADGKKILTHWSFTSPATFHKTNTDTLTLYVNHTMLGA